LLGRFFCFVFLNSVQLKRRVTSPSVKLWCHTQHNTC